MHHGFAAPDLAAPLADAKAGALAFRVLCHDSMAPALGAWGELERRGHATPFQSRAWLGAWYERIAPLIGATPVIVDVRDARDGTPLLLWPLCLRRQNGLLCLGEAGGDVGDYAAPLFARGFAQALAVAPGARHTLERAIRPALPRADLLRLTRLPEMVAGVPMPMVLPKTHWPESYSAWALDLAGSRAAFRDGLKDASFARELERKARRLAGRGPVHFAEAVSAEDRRRVFRLLCEQRAARFAERGRDDILSSAAHRPFYADVVLGDSGLARLFFLAVGDETIATMLCLESPGTLHLIMSTIVEGPWKSSSPGLNSIAALIDWMIAHGFRTLDFTIGDEPYKVLFGATRRPLRAGMEALSPRALLPVARARAKEAARPLIEALPAPLAARIKALAKGRA